MTRVTLPFVFAFAFAFATRHAIADEQADAERLYNEGQRAFDGNKYDDALNAWQKSYDLSREPGLLFNIAQAYRLRAQKGDCAKAAETYRKFIELDPSSAERQAAQDFAAETEKCAATERATATPAPKIDSGTERNSNNPGRSKRLAGLGIAGGGVLLVGVGIYFGRRASTLGDDVTSACVANCDWAIYGPKESDGQSAETKQYIFDGLGAAAIIGGGVLYWLGSRERSTSSVAVTSQRGGAAFTWSGSW